MGITGLPRLNTFPPNAFGLFNMTGNVWGMVRRLVSNIILHGALPKSERSPRRDTSRYNAAGPTSAMPRFLIVTACRPAAESRRRLPRAAWDFVVRGTRDSVPGGKLLARLKRAASVLAAHSTIVVVRRFRMSLCTIEST